MSHSPGRVQNRSKKLKKFKKMSLCHIHLIYIYHYISYQTFFVWTLLLILLFKDLKKEKKILNLLLDNILMHHCDLNILSVGSLHFVFYKKRCITPL